MRAGFLLSIAATLLLSLGAQGRPSETMGLLDVVKRQEPTFPPACEATCRAVRSTVPVSCVGVPESECNCNNAFGQAFLECSKCLVDNARDVGRRAQISLNRFVDGCAQAGSPIDALTLPGQEHQPPLTEAPDDLVDPNADTTSESDNNSALQNARSSPALFLIVATTVGVLHVLS